MFLSTEPENDDSADELIITDNLEYRKYSILPLVRKHSIPYVFMMNYFDNEAHNEIIEIVNENDGNINGVYCEWVDTSRFPNYFQ